jgi:hypothetical protein
MHGVPLDLAHALHYYTDVLHHLPHGFRIRYDYLYSPFSLRLTSVLLLRVAVFLCLAWQVAITILLAVIGQYHMNMYTYWSYTIQTAFYALLFVALFYQRTLFTLTVMVVLPFVLGNVVFVAVAIVVIIANNAQAYIDGTVCDVPPGKTTIEHLHTGDWEIHGGTVFRLFVVLLCGLEYFSQRIIVRQLVLWRAPTRWLFFFYWMVGPILLITIYQLCFDVDKLYPTSFNLVQRTFILAGITLVWQLISWLIFTQVQQLHSIHAHALPTYKQLFDAQHQHIEILEQQPPPPPHPEELTL